MALRLFRRFAVCLPLQKTIYKRLALWTEPTGAVLEGGSSTDGTSHLIYCQVGLLCQAKNALCVLLRQMNQSKSETDHFSQWISHSGIASPAISPFSLKLLSIFIDVDVHSEESGVSDLCFSCLENVENLSCDELTSSSWFCNRDFWGNAFEKGFDCSSTRQAHDFKWASHSARGRSMDFCSRVKTNGKVCDGVFKTDFSSWKRYVSSRWSLLFLWQENCSGKGF